MKSFRWMYGLIRDVEIETLNGERLMTSRFLAPKIMPDKVAKWLAKRLIDKEIDGIWNSLKRA